MKHALQTLDFSVDNYQRSCDKNRPPSMIHSWESEPRAIFYWHYFSMSFWRGMIRTTSLVDYFFDSHHLR